MDGVQVASLFGVLSLQTDQWDSALDNAGQQADSFGVKLQNIGMNVMNLGGALTSLMAPVTAFLQNSVQAFSADQTAIAQTNAVLKSTAGIAGVTADQVTKLANSLASTTEFSRDATISAENLLLTFTNIGSNIFPDVTQVTLDMSQALGQDLKSSAIQLGKALQDPITGLTALKRVGVNFTDAQKQQIQALVDAGQTEQAQVVILKELQREFGGSAQAAGGTFAGQMDILNHKLNDFQIKVGTLIMPTLSKFADFIGGVIDQVSAWADANPQLFSTIVQVAGAVAAAGPVIIALGMAITNIGVIAETVGPIIGGAIDLALGPIGLLIAGVVALYAAFQSNFLGIRDFLTPILDQIKIVVTDVANAFQRGGLIAAVEQLFGDFEDGSTIITKILEQFGVMPATAQKISDAIGKVVGVIDDVVQAIIADLPLVPFYLQYYFGKIWSVVGPALKPILDWFTGTGSNSLSGAVTAAWDFLNKTFIQPIVGIWTVFFKPSFDLIIGWFTGSGRDSFQGAVSSAWNFINQNFIQPLSTFWTSTLKPGFDAMVSFFTNLWNNTLKPALQPILDFFGTLSTDINNLVGTFNALNSNPKYNTSSGGGSSTFSAYYSPLPGSGSSTPGSFSPLPSVTGTAAGGTSSTSTRVSNNTVHVNLPNVTNIGDPNHVNQVADAVLERLGVPA